MASAYILYSKKGDSYYVGVTTESATSRLHKHNNSIYGNHFTSKATDWQLRLEIGCENFSEARKIELYIKGMKSRKFIEKLIGNDEEIERLKRSVE